MHNGKYKELPIGGKNIYFDTTFLNKYVYFEVIPICPITGFSGTPIRSFPFQVGYLTEENQSTLPMFTPVISDKIYSESTFSDIDEHWSKEYITLLSQSGVVSGKTDNQFCPDDAVTRAEFSEMLSISFSVNTASTLSSFEDVGRGDWYYNYVNSLYVAGIVNGTTYNTFSPHRSLTREEAVVMMVRLFEKATSDIAPVGQVIFADKDNISPWAVSPAGKAVRLGLIQGDPDGAFVPKGNLTRGEAAALIIRLAKILKKG